MKESTHNPPPWHVGTPNYDNHDAVGIRTNDDWVIADVWRDALVLPGEDNADHIVKCVNNHDALVALAEEVAKPYEDAADWKDAIGKLQRMANEALSNIKEKQS